MAFPRRTPEPGYVDIPGTIPTDEFVASAPLPPPSVMAQLRGLLPPVKPDERKRGEAA